MNPWHRPSRPALVLMGLAWSLPLLVGGCAGTSAPATSPAPLPPAAVRDGDDEPQVVIRTEDPERVRQAAVALVGQFGGRLVRARPDQLLFSRAGKAAADPAATPVYFVRLTLRPAGPGRVRASASGMVTGPRPAGLSDARARTFLLAGLQRLQAAVESGN